MVRTQPFQGCNARFEPGADHQWRVAADNSLPTHAELISMWLGNIVLEKSGTKLGYSQVAKAPVFDTGTAGSNPAIPAMIRYSRGSRGQTANLLFAGWRQRLQPITCNCPVGSCSRRLDGAKPLFSQLRKCKSNPARISSGESPQTIRYQLERLL